MTFLAPWTLVVGGLAAAGAVLLHLVARQRPAAYLLPTTRFIPDRRTLVSRVASRPRDLLLLALRVLLLLSAAAAFARPVLLPSRAPLARLVLLDRAASVTSVRPLFAAGVPAHLITFDTAATTSESPALTLDSLARDTIRGAHAGSISAALVAARRLAPTIAREADSVELTLVAPVTVEELDRATRAVRASWPGRITVVLVPARAGASSAWTLERPLDADDPLAPTLSAVRIDAGPGSVRLRRSALSPADSAFARSGGAVVLWDSATTAPPHAEALVLGDDVVVAAMGRGALLQSGRIVARWGDGSAAASEQGVGTGCVRRVAVAVPTAGDLPLRPAFQRIVRGLMSPCGSTGARTAADSTEVERLRGADGFASANALLGAHAATSPVAAWLLGLALVCALAELLVRTRLREELA